MPLQSCESCVYWRRLNDDQGLCRRHAPSASNRAEEVAHWPHTRGRQGCGEGRAAGEASVARCADCAFWLRHKGGLHPMNRSDMPNSWWREAGLCARWAPHPGMEPGPRGFWRATAGSDGCGDGADGPSGQAAPGAL